MKAIISPSMLSSDFANLERDAKELVKSGADWLHMDVMDGHFVPNITIGAPVIKSLRKKVDTYMECHMMVEHPERWVKQFAEAGASCYTFHIEADIQDVHQLIKDIKDHGMDVGISIKPQTPVDTLAEYLDDIDLVLVMTVEPGFGGQKFMSNMMPKIRWLRKMKPNINIGVDGGINEDNVDLVSDAGANMIVSGSTILNAKEYGQVIGNMKNVVANNMKN